MKKHPKCAFNFKIPADPIAIIGMVRPMFVEAGGTVTGENADFTFSMPTKIGRFDGACKVLEPTLVNITVTERPEVISCKMIQKQLTVYITEAVKMYNQQSKAAANGEAADLAEEAAALAEEAADLAEEATDLAEEAADLAEEAAVLNEEALLVDGLAAADAATDGEVSDGRSNGE